MSEYSARRGAVIVGVSIFLCGGACGAIAMNSLRGVARALTLQHRDVQRSRDATFRELYGRYSLPEAPYCAWITFAASAPHLAVGQSHDRRTPWPEVLPMLAAEQGKVVPDEAVPESAMREIWTAEEALVRNQAELTRRQLVAVATAQSLSVDPASILVAADGTVRILEKKSETDEIRTLRARVEDSLASRDALLRRIVAEYGHN